MKKIICLFVLGVLLLGGIGSIAKAQGPNNNLVLTTVTPAAGPYQCGSLIQLTYSLDYTMLAGNREEIKISFDPGVLALESVVNQTGFSGPVITTGSPAVYTYTSLPVSVADNNFGALLTFTVTFRVINTTCSAQFNSGVTATASTLDPSNNAVNPVASTFNFTSFCSGSAPTVSMSLLSGSACGYGLYKVTSFGLDIPNSNFSLTLPTGVSLLAVYNTQGNPVAFTPAGSSSSGSSWSWSRSGINTEVTQIHYVLINVDKAAVCSNTTQCPGGNCNINLAFATHTICSPNNAATAAPVNLQVNCCGACPSCPPGNGQTGIPLSSGYLLMSKMLVQTPFRYLPSPDNCKTHDYYIKIDNLSSQNLADFKLTDLISNIGSQWDAIDVTSVEASISGIGGASGQTFTCQLSPPGSLSPGALVLSSSPAVANYTTGSFPAAANTDLVIERTPGFLFPAFSSLLVKITHRLNNPLAATSYENIAKLDFTENNIPYAVEVKLPSQRDNYDPVISLTKLVRNVTTNTAFMSSVNAVPGDVLEFVIKVRNYGLSSVPSGNLTDIINDPGNNYLTQVPSTLAVTGTGYSTSECTTVKNAIIASFAANGFAAAIQPINKAVCAAGSELVITYQVRVKPAGSVFCSTDYTNQANLAWVWNGQTFNLSKTAVVKLDLFKNVICKLEATCNGPKATPGQWQIGSISSLPGQWIWYRAVVKNNNSFTVNNLKVMLQVPIGGSAYSSTHTAPGAIPSLTILTASMPAGGSLGSVSGLSASPAAVTSSVIINDWLTTGVPAPSPSSAKLIYQVIPSLAPGTSATIRYAVQTPYYFIGSAYQTEMGVSQGANNNCPIVKKASLTQTISQQTNCGSISGCGLVHYDHSLVSMGGGMYKLTLSNIIDLNGPGFPNISNVKVVVHQPYKNITIPSPPSPFNKPMAPFVLTSLSPVVPLAAALSPGARAFTLTGFPVVNGAVSVNIQIPLAFLNTYPSYPVIIPVNVSCWMNDGGACPQLCEQMLYLKL